MKFTKEEVSLCKQVAEKHRKEINWGDWFFWENDKELKPLLNSYGNYDLSQKHKDVIPLWTISNCLEFLKGKCQDHVFLSHDEGDDEEWYLWFDEYKKTQQMGKGKTPLVACLEVVLAVLEEEK